MNKYKVVLKNGNSVEVECKEFFNFDDRTVFYNIVEKEEDIELEVRNEELSYIQKIESELTEKEKFVSELIQKAVLSYYPDNLAHNIIISKSFAELVENCIKQ